MIVRLDNHLQKIEETMQRIEKLIEENKTI